MITDVAIFYLYRLYSCRPLAPRQPFIYISGPFNNHLSEHNRPNPFDGMSKIRFNLVLYDTDTSITQNSNAPVIESERANACSARRCAPCESSGKGEFNWVTDQVGNELLGLNGESQIHNQGYRLHVIRYFERRAQQVSLGS